MIQASALAATRQWIRLPSLPRRNPPPPSPSVPPPSFSQDFGAYIRMWKKAGMLSDLHQVQGAQFRRDRHLHSKWLERAAQSKVRAVSAGVAVLSLSIAGCCRPVPARVRTCVRGCGATIADTYDAPFLPPPSYLLPPSPQPCLPTYLSAFTPSAARAGLRFARRGGSSRSPRRRRSCAGRRCASRRCARSDCI